MQGAIAHLPWHNKDVCFAPFVIILLSCQTPWLRYVPTLWRKCYTEFNISHNTKHINYKNTHVNMNVDVTACCGELNTL